MERNCDACGLRYAARSKNSLYCSEVECRRQRERARRRRRVSGATVVTLPARSNISADAPDGAGIHELATRAALEEAERLESPAGVNAIGLARRLDAANGESGSSYAALARQHLAAVDKALEGARVSADPIDELFARRQKKLGAS